MTDAELQQKAAEIKKRGDAMKLTDHSIPVLSVGESFSQFIISPTPSELEAMRKQTEREQWEKRNKRVEELTEKSNVPRRQWYAEIERRSDVPWRQKERTLLDRMGKGFLIALVGIRGNGKTQLAVELIRSAVNNLRPALYCTATEFFMDVKATYRKDSKTTERDVISEYRKPALLVIDEAGKRSDSEWENRLLFELIDKRYQDTTDTLMIGNQTPEEFKTSIGASLVSRICEVGGIIECTWPSFRKP